METQELDTKAEDRTAEGTFENSLHITMEREFFRKAEGVLVPLEEGTTHLSSTNAQSLVTNDKEPLDETELKTNVLKVRGKVDAQSLAVGLWLTQTLNPQGHGERFDIIQKWEGLVVETGDDTFVAELTTISGDEDDLIAEIYLKNIHKDDLVLVKPGAIFYWSIGYVKTPKGTTKRKSSIRFRRLPPWTSRQLNKIKGLNIDNPTL